MHQTGHLIGMNTPSRATQRPEPFAKPAYWSNSPAPPPAVPPVTADPDGLSPTRYGDWEKNGIAIDF